MTTFHLVSALSFGSFAAAWAWLCLELHRNILSAWRNAESGESRCPQDRISCRLAPAALTPYEVNSKCPVVTPLATEMLGNTSGSRPGRISTGGGVESRERGVTSNGLTASETRITKDGRLANLVTVWPSASRSSARPARRSFNRRRHSLARWMAFNRTLN